MDSGSTVVRMAHGEYGGDSLGFNLPLRAKRILHVVPGLEFQLLLTISREEILSFCGITRDLNPIHLDAEAAKAAGFPGGRIVPGFLTVSRMIGEVQRIGFFSEPILFFQEAYFVNPIYEGMPVEFTLRFVALAPWTDSRWVAHLSFTAIAEKMLRAKGELKILFVG